MPLGKEAGLGPGHIVLNGDLVGTQPPQQPFHTFRPMSIVAKRSPISATAELLFNSLLAARLSSFSQVIRLSISLLCTLSNTNFLSKSCPRRCIPCWLLTSAVTNFRCHKLITN